MEVLAVEVEVRFSRAGARSTGNRGSKDSRAGFKASKLDIKGRPGDFKDRGTGSKASKARSSCRSRSTTSSRLGAIRPRLARSPPKARSRLSKELLSPRLSLPRRCIRRRLRFTNLARLGFRAHIRPLDPGSSLSRLILPLAPWDMVVQMG